MKRITILLTLTALLLLAGSVVAQSGDSASAGSTASEPKGLHASYDLSWWTVDGGGETFSSGGVYDLGGTIGQPDAAVMASGDYTLGGGFWGDEALAAEYDVYLPLILK